MYEWFLEFIGIIMTFVCGCIFGAMIGATYPDWIFEEENQED